ncbi:hypothetical protein BsWGS_09408 [Bradybaena similaris]
MNTPTKKSTRISVVESDQIVQHILPLKTSKLRIGIDSKDLKYVDSSSQKKNSQLFSDSSDDDEDSSRLINAQSTVFDNEEPESVSGREMFQFKTPKKSGQMVIKAQDSCSPGTPKTKTGRVRSQESTSSSPGRRAQIFSTPPKSDKKHLVASPLTQKKPCGVSAARDHKRMESSTPYRLRKRNLNLEHAASSSDDSISDSSDDKEEEEDEGEDPKQQSTGNRPARNTDTNMVATAETYFDLHSMAPLTSDRTLSALDGPRLDVDTIREVLKQVDVGHHKEMDKLMSKHVHLFKRWMLNMCCGYNILLHGLGSKRTLLEKFREDYLSKFSHLVINGYFPSLTVKHVLNSITEEILGNSKGFSSVYSQIEFIRDSYKNQDEDFYLVIHNIDGVLLRSDKSQEVLSLLSEIEGFHIIASIDHINSVLMWDQNRYFRFRWLWYETPTYLPYEAENGYENSLMVQQSGTLALSSTVHVMRSLTPNARQVFLLLARYQMEEGDSPHYTGMAFQNLYHKCREAFLVNSDLTLQAQLVEFKDHRLIRSKKNYEGVEHLVIPLDRATLKAFLLEYKDSVS